MHSALSALDSIDTQHSVPLTLQALSAECEHRVWSHAVIPDDLGPLSLSLYAPGPHPGLASPPSRSESSPPPPPPLPVTLKSDPGPPAARPCAGTKTFVPKQIVKITAGEILGKPSGTVSSNQSGEFLPISSFHASPSPLREA